MAILLLVKDRDNSLISSSKDFFCGRPISVCDYDENTIKIIYKTVGAGTKEYVARCGKDETLDVLTGLGNGYDYR